ncbi:MAG: cytochrome c biogenesis protein ResB [Mariprofundaceae bacterium]|nr:cytochrome c biogenesis protein ResB [Mariprofundaceae bacterium]
MSQASHPFRTITERIGSMPLAITLLVVLALASVIGTVLQQNQSQQDYLQQFGPLWYWLFRALGLFDMYHTWWFIGLLGFLMVTLSFCLWRNVPRLLKQMRNRKVYISDRAFGHIKHQQSWQVSGESAQTFAKIVQSRLKEWQWQTEQRGDVLYLRGDRGRRHKLGYIAVHSAMLIILIGGWMSVQLGFRGNMSVVEGTSEKEISFLKGTGVEHKTMPFEIRCNSFDISFYPNGMPSEFRSNLTIIDNGKEVLKNKDIIVNEPLYYKGIRIYQASFGDGGSDIEFKFYAMDGSATIRNINTQVYQTYVDKVTGISMEITDFRPHNVENMADSGEAKDFQDLGPSVDFVIRGKGLKPVKVRSFLNPFELAGENRGSIMMISKTGDVRDFESVSLGIDFSNPQEWALFNAFIGQLQTVDLKDKKAKFTAFKAALEQVFGDNRPANFQAMAVRVLNATQILPRMPWPFLPVLEDYEQKYYTGLQLAEDPGMNVVWIGSALLVIGLCIMLYISHRKLWLIIRPENAGYKVSLAGLSNRNPLNFNREFNELLSRINDDFGAHLLKTDAPKTSIGDRA